jgi:hypothetical protein
VLTMNTYPEQTPFRDRYREAQEPPLTPGRASGHAGNCLF